jgi:DNA sulfur modification protein DndD
MLRINRVELENFGPYKGSQSIELPDEPGVTIVYGENMRGKTSLLNAIRYALFGKILGRGSRNISPEEYINWESLEEGNYSFSVTLVFESEGSEFELTRQYQPRSSVGEPKSEDDYTEEIFLKKDGSIMGPDQRDQEIAQILPEQVSRFFLFDGELLQQYEELLIDESEMGRQIREAIERILGVPVLKNGRADLRELLQDAESQESKAAQKSELTKELGVQLETAQEKRRHFEEELEELKTELETLEEDKATKRGELDEIEAIRSKMEEKDDLKERIEEIDSSLKTKNDKLRDLMDEAWYSVLEETIQERRSVLDQKERELQEQRIEASVAEELAERFSKAVNDNRCPICDQDIDSEHKSNLESEIKKLENEAVADGGETPDSLGDVARAVDILKTIERSNPEERIADTVSEIDGLKAEKATKQDKIKEIEQDIDSSKEKRAARLNSEHEKIIKKMSVKEQAIKEQQSDIDDVKETIEKLKESLDDISGDEIDEERERRQLYQELVDLFDDGVAQYRDGLRERVEQDASNIFLQLTTEPEYERLEINENYGLSIVHESGDKISVRSSGAEHVVALALMGALQNNAPLKGPIIMDSPFGRLDEGHVRNVVDTLPSLTEQVMLLVYEDELEIEDAREILGGKLRKEYTMQRVTARHTDLVPGGVTDE